MDVEGNFPWQDDKASGSGSMNNSGNARGIGGTAGSSIASTAGSKSQVSKFTFQTSRTHIL